MATSHGISAADGHVTAPTTGHNNWGIVWGVLLIISGILAVLMPEIAALATTVVFAWLLIFGGVFELLHAMQTRHESGFAWKLLSGILTLVLGIAILMFPIAGVASLGLLVGSFLLVGGITRLVLAFQCKGQRG